MPGFDPRLQCYAITDQSSALGRDDVLVARALLDGGSTCLQYRAKKTAIREQYLVAGVLRKMTKEAGVLFIINDRVDLALAVDADGVHLGQDDLPLPVARALAHSAGRSDLLIGKSTHSFEQAMTAQKEGADYIGYGPLYATQTKENNVPPLGCASLGPVLGAVSVPLVAIGGIKLGHLRELKSKGAFHCAIVTALTGASDVQAAAAGHWRLWRSLC